MYVYIYRNSFGKQNCRRQHFLCKNAVILQKRRRIQKMTDLQMYVEATKCTNYTHFQLQRNYWQLRRNCGQLRRLETWITPSKNLQTRIAGAGLKTPGSFKRRLLPGKVAFFLKGNNKRAFGASRYVCMYIYMGMAQKTGMDRSAVIRTYGTRSCQQAFWSGPCHKGLHGYE